MSIHVVAAIIRSKENQILIARRREGKSLAGYFEFPGGKVDEGESHEVALIR
ncbi:MAG: (deoxy)nucleoside triphosphate pyrophosphohydrolase, partial [Firmicutes bacterium HGW-Firmicutes-3]